MNSEQKLTQIVNSTKIPFFLVDASVRYNDAHLSTGTVREVLPYLENKDLKTDKGYSIKILTEDGINHTINVVKGNGSVHYFQNEKNLHFDDKMNFIYHN